MKAPRIAPDEAVPALLEREAELELLERLSMEAAAGRGSFVLVEGPAGIGKTRLLDELKRRAADHGASVLRARGGELERGFAFGVVRQLYEPPLARATGEERTALLAGAAVLVAPLLAPGEVDEPPREAAEASFSLLHGLFWLTANLAEREPVVLVVDDLHWSDPASLRFLSYLTHRLEGLPILLAAAARHGEPGADAALLGELAGDPAATIVRPAPLSLAGVRELLPAGGLGDADPEFELAEQQRVAAAGEQGLGTDADAAQRVRDLGSPSLARFVLRRLRRLGAGAEALGRAVAVLGNEAELEVAAALAGLELEDAVAAADALARVEILRLRGRLAFAHPVLRAAVYDDLTEPARELAHQRAAELLTQRGATSQGVAAHLLHVPGRGRAEVVATLRAAARRAGSEGAADVARAYLARAAAEPPAGRELPEVLFELGAAELSSGVPGAIEHLEEAQRLLRGGPRAVDAALACAYALYSGGRPYDAADLLRRAIDDVDPEDAALAQQAEAQVIAWARFDARLYPMARARLDRIGPAASGESFGGRFLLALEASELARAGEEPERARERAERALAGALLGREENWQPYLLALATLITLDDLDAAVSRCDDWLELARRRGSPFAYSHASSFRALAMLRRGDLLEAEADARAALDVLPPAGARKYAFTLAHLTEVFIERGELAEAARMLELADVPGEEAPTWQMARWLAARARLRVAAGESERGLSELLAVGERLLALGVHNPSHAAWRSEAALLLRARGDRRQALRLVREELGIARRWRAPRPLGAALRAAGLVEEGEAGLELLRESVEVLAPSPARLDRAKSLTELGAALRRGGRRAEARELLREGFELARHCEATPLAERAHAELLATGARPRRLVRTGLDALTPSERRVAQMAAEGRINREIAQALFVTPKTVEMHLSHAYRKLGLQSRSQLAGALTTVALDAAEVPR